MVYNLALWAYSHAVYVENFNAVIGERSNTMKNIKDIEKMTMDQILESLEENVSDYNISTNAEEKVDLAVEQKAFVEKYNELSLLKTYAECMAEDKPIIALAKAYYYPVISVKDAVHSEVNSEGKKITSVTRSIKEGDKKLNLFKFIEWAEECNKNVTESKRWRTDLAKVRLGIEDQWKAFFATKKDSKSISIGKTKKALQEAIDALVYVKAETGDFNAVIATNDTAKWLIAFANTRKDKKEDGIVTITGTILSKQQWATLMMDILHMTVEGKQYVITLGHEDEDNATEAEPEAEAEEQAEA